VKKAFTFVILSGARNLSFFSHFSGAGFSLRGFGFARTKTRRLKRAPHNCQTEERFLAPLGMTKVVGVFTTAHLYYEMMRIFF